MSNEIPEHLQRMIEELRKKGINVTVAQVAAGQVNIESDEPSPLHKVMSQALNAMGEHNFDAHRRCLTMNAMQVIGMLVNEAGALIDTMQHLEEKHDSVEAAEWIVSTLKLVDALTGVVSASERDTGNAFQFTNNDPAHDGHGARAIQRAEARLAELKAKAAPLH